jgi:NADH dehydrogenase
MPFPEDLAGKATRSLVKLGVTVKCGAMVVDVNKEGLTIEVDKHADYISAKTVISAGGITASPLGQILARRTKAETDKGGRVKVKPGLTLCREPDLSAIADGGDNDHDAHRDDDIAAADDDGAEQHRRGNL